MAREQRQPRASCRTRGSSAGSQELGNKAASVLQRTAKYRHHQPKRQLCMSSVLRWVVDFNASKITVGTEFTMPSVKWGQCIKLMGSAEGEKKKKNNPTMYAKCSPKGLVGSTQKSLVCASVHHHEKHGDFPRSYLIQTAFHSANQDAGESLGKQRRCEI